MGIAQISLPQAGRQDAPAGYTLPDDLEVVIPGTSPAAEQFRRLTAYLSDPAVQPAQAIVVTSPVPGDGKSFVCLNLALAFGRGADGETLLIDADLRRPGITGPISPRPPKGLEDVLRGSIGPLDAVVKLENHPLCVLGSGSRGEDAIQHLTADRLARILGPLRNRFSRILIDTPPVIPFSDAVLIGGQVDGVLLVARSNQTPKACFEDTVEMLEGVRVLGVTLNGAVRSLIDLNHDYSYYHRKYYR